MFYFAINEKTLGIRIENLEGILYGKIVLGPSNEKSMKNCMKVKFGIRK